MNLQEIGEEGADWINLNQDEHKRQAVAKAVMDLRAL
jgi:hypothetical protein